MLLAHTQFGIQLQSILAGEELSLHSACTNTWGYFAYQQNFALFLLKFEKFFLT